MIENNSFDIIIIGGSYAGLAAGMSFGRALKQTLIIDSGKPCNRQTPHSHNFLTNDGKSPAEISSVALQQVKNYDSVHIINDTAINAEISANGFIVNVESGKRFEAGKLIFATGITDIHPPLKGFDECWGISVLHCPFCHGYEIRNKKTGILGNGDAGFDFTKLIFNWTNDLTLFTDGKSNLTVEQKKILHGKGIKIIENKIDRLNHVNGYLKSIRFIDGSEFELEAIYAPSPFKQHCSIPETIGCELTDEGYIKTDVNYETTVKGIYAIGDNSSKTRTVANAVAMGNHAGILISRQMIAI